MLPVPAPLLFSASLLESWESVLLVCLSLPLLLGALLCGVEDEVAVVVVVLVVQMLVSLSEPSSTPSSWLMRCLPKVLLKTLNKTNDY